MSGSNGVSSHLDVLDGWRGLSILAVLAAHLLPLGPQALQGNILAGVTGMALFFTLSGFLITRFLLEHSSVVDFLIRRVFRIVPLAWLAILVTFPWFGADAGEYVANLLFVANLPPTQLIEPGSHFWSLCIEVQFYAGIALLFALLGRRGLLLIPVICVAVTVYRVATGARFGVVTAMRVDEILAGGVMALAYMGALGAGARRWLGSVNTYVMLPVFLLSCHPIAGPLNFLRPYCSALLIGSTLMSPTAGLDRVLKNKALAYVATISYALYVVHHFLIFTWMGSGDTMAKYLKRPLLFAVTFALAHVSTFYFEKRFIAYGKQLSRRLLGSGKPVLTP
jgi:peptidoglycan/LPS O-acetylase OafA/YrhL